MVPRGVRTAISAPKSQMALNSARRYPLRRSLHSIVLIMMRLLAPEVATGQESTGDKSDLLGKLAIHRDHALGYDILGRIRIRLISRVATYHRPEQQADDGTHLHLNHLHRQLGGHVI